MFPFFFFFFFLVFLDLSHFVIIVFLKNKNKNKNKITIFANFFFFNVVRNTRIHVTREQEKRNYCNKFKKIKKKKKSSLLHL